MGHRGSKLQTALVVSAMIYMAFPAASATAGPWKLMSRHGDCFEIATLQRKVADLGEIRDPEAFVSLLRQKGYQVQAKETILRNGRAVEVAVPQLELGLLFVEASLCKGDSR